MRLSVYYNQNKDKYITKYDDRFHELPLYSTNHYGHVIVQYIYIYDRRVFYDYKSYSKYLSKKLLTFKKIRYSIGQKIMDIGRYICFGKKDKVKVIYVYKYPKWKK